jgi:hypothetical protein
MLGKTHLVVCHLLVCSSLRFGWGLPFRCWPLTWDSFTWFTATVIYMMRYGHPVGITGVPTRLWRSSTKKVFASKLNPALAKSMTEWLWQEGSFGFVSVRIRFDVVHNIALIDPGDSVQIRFYVVVMLMVTAEEPLRQGWWPSFYSKADRVTGIVLWSCICNSCDRLGWMTAEEPCSPPNQTVRNTMTEVRSQN